MVANAKPRHYTAEEREKATKRAMEVFHHCFDHGAMVRYTGDIVALGPAAIAAPGEIDRIIDGVRQALRHIA